LNETDRIGGQKSQAANTQIRTRSGYLGTVMSRFEKSARLRDSVRITNVAVMQSLVLAKMKLFCRGAGSAAFFDNKWRFLDFCIAQVSLPGEWCEFGVFQGESLRFISSRATVTVHAFDSFKGLPAACAGMGRGTFSTDGELPNTPANVAFHIGWFRETLPTFVESRALDPLALVHIDSDLYSSALTVLRNIEPFLRRGTIPIFDELLGVFNNDEYNALRRVMKIARLRVQWVAFYLYADWGIAACLRVV
jgi:hypothetical protein